MSSEDILQTLHSRNSGRVFNLKKSIVENKPVLLLPFGNDRETQSPQSPKRKRQETREKRKKYLEFKLVLLGVLQWNVIFSKPSFSLPILQQDEPNLLP
jgi:hypothetical protein